MRIYPQASNGKLSFQTGSFILAYLSGEVNKNFPPQKRMTSRPKWGKQSNSSKSMVLFIYQRLFLPPQQILRHFQYKFLSIGSQFAKNRQ